MHSYDLIYLSETWLDSRTSIDPSDLSLKGYNLDYVDVPDNVKKEGFVFIIKKLGRSFFTNKIRPMYCQRNHF